MKKTIICLVVGLFLTAGAALAQNEYQVSIGADVHVSDIYFDHLLNNTDEGTKINQWELVIRGRLNPTPDLMLLIDHALGMASSSNNEDFSNDAYMSTTYTQGSLLYQFYTIEPMTVHAGLGYHFATAHFKKLVEQEGQVIPNVHLDGSGFIASSQVTFHVMEALEIKALVQAAPWYSWTYRANQYEVDTGGSVYSYQLTADYSINDQLLIRLGYGGSRTTVGAIKLQDDYEIKKATYKQGGLQVGFSYRF